MIVNNLRNSPAFTTKDGSEIRSLLDRTNAPVQMQSLAEATIQPGASTQRHRHLKTEELYYVTQGTARMDIDGEIKDVVVGDAILIPAGAAHKIICTSTEALKILCCCAPPYSHEDTIILE